MKKVAAAPVANKKGEGIAGKYVMHIKDVNKALPDHTPLLSDVNLSVYYGYVRIFDTLMQEKDLLNLLNFPYFRAKIGILGINGKCKKRLNRAFTGLIVGC